MTAELAILGKTESEAEPEAQALAKIVAWSEDKPAWMRDALRRLCQKDQLEKSDINELTDICIGETAAFSPITMDDIRDPSAATDTVVLRRIHSVHNVNALAEEQELTIADNGVTVIYGDNGSGKSGYVRILKRICRARGEKEEIQGNIYKGQKGTPKAQIDFKVNGKKQDASWTQGSSADSALSSISVFDTKTASVHVNEVHDVAYTPFPMQLLETLAKIAKEIQNHIGEKITEIQSQTPLALKNLEVAHDTEVRNVLDNLSSDTKPETINVLASLTAKDEDRLKLLQSDLADDPRKISAKLEALKDRIEKESVLGTALCVVVSSDKVNELSNSYSDYKNKEDAARLAAEKLFTESPLPAVGSETWRVLWEAARNYSRTEVYKGLPFPVTGEDAKCVLCQQNLKEDGTKERLRNFEKYVTDEARKQANEAKRKVDSLLGYISGQKITKGRAKEIYIMLHDEADVADLALVVKKAIVQAKWNLRKILAGFKNSDFLPPAEIMWPESELKEIVSALDKRVKVLRDPDQEKTRKILEKEKTELEARKWLNVEKRDVLAEIDRKKKIQSLTLAKKQTNPRPITDLSTSLSINLVTKALRGQFIKEVGKLEVSNLAIELVKAKSSYGVPKFRVALIHKPDAKIGEILSEGEHRCIALAAFLAELATTESKSGIVLDDPISSLDHNYRGTVADRLAAEGQHRQIIIFTHDLAFLFLLNAACKDKVTSITFRSISRNDDHAGFCNTSAPPKAQPVDQRIDGLQKHLNNTKQFYGNDRWEKTVKDFVRDSREIWESAVEDILEPAVKRLANKVDTKGLIKVSAITDDDCKVMRQGYKRCSNLIHKESDLLNPPLPSPGKLQNEIDCLSKWYSDIKARQNAITPM